MGIRAIDHVQIAVNAAELEASRRFYSELLGLREVRLDGGPTVRLALGFGRLDLLPSENWGTPPRAAHVAFEVDDLPSLRQRLLAEKLPIDESRPLPGYWRLYVADPSGNQIELLQPNHDSGAGA